MALLVQHASKANLQLEFCPNNSSSAAPFPDELWYVKPWYEISVKAGLFVPVVGGGIVANVAILDAVRRNRLLRLAPLNIYIANMAACDLCALLLGPWLLMCIDSFQNFVLGAFFCKTEGFVQSSLLLGGVFSLIAISADRFVAIVFPKTRKMSIALVWCVVATTWILGIAISVPLIIFRNYHERQWSNFVEKFCMEDSEVLSVYWYIMIALLVWLPLLVMLICYTSIFIKLTKYARQARSSVVNPSRDFRTRVTRMVLILVSVFMVCRVPFTALIYVRIALHRNFTSHNQIGEAFGILWFVAHFMIYTNAAINPIIYGMTNEGFRHAIRRAFRCLCASDSQGTEQVAEIEAGAEPRALQPREAYHIEPCWRPISVQRSESDVQVCQRELVKL